MYRIISTPANRLRHLRRHPPTSLSLPTDATITDKQRAYHILWHYQILDPNSDIVANWNRIFLITSLIALFIDPLYLYLPYVGGPGCLATSIDLSVTVTLLRSFSDLFYLLHMIMKFRTAFIARGSRAFGRGVLVTDAKKIAIRYLRSDFSIDLAATLPLPQIVIWLVLPSSSADRAHITLSLFVLIQYVPRLFLIFPLNRRIVKTSGVVAKTPWTGAAYNMLLYMLASHVIGATWYLSAIARQLNCWTEECKAENSLQTLSCLTSYLDCGSLGSPDRQYWLNVTNVIKSCDVKSGNNKYSFGMFQDAFRKAVATGTFSERFFYCLWWGIKNLSSYGQTLDTTVFLGETLFSILLCVVGLVLFALLIGNVQTYLESMSARLEEWRIRKKDTEEWMKHRQLPDHLQERVRRFVHYQWLATRGVDEKSILQSLPLDLRRDIQRHLCLGLVKKVSFFSQMDDQVLDAICERLVSCLILEGAYIFREGDPVDEMLFIIRGKLDSSTTNGERTDYFDSNTLGQKDKDFCGEELLTWALMPNSSLDLPSSTRTVKAVTKVEAFALKAEDLKAVATLFKQRHSKKLQHAFRYYSPQWREWAACIIEAAWRRYMKQKSYRELSLRESLYYIPRPEVEEDSNSDKLEMEEVSLNDNSDQVLGATVRASTFAANVRKGTTSTSHNAPLFKPDEPDFSLL